MTTTRTPVVSQEGLGDNATAWVKNKMDAFSAWQYKNGNWFSEFNINAENAEEYIKHNYGFNQTTKTVSKFAQLYLGKANNSADVLAILLESIKKANAFLKEGTDDITEFLNKPDVIVAENLDLTKLKHYAEISLPGELRQVVVATISPKHYMNFYHALGQLNKNFLNTAKEFAASQPALRKAANELQDKNAKALINKLIDFRMQSLKLYMHYFDSIALYCRDCLDNVTTNPDEIPSEESFMKSTLKNIRKRAKQISTEDHDVNISVSQDNDQGETDETDINAPGDGTEPNVDINGEDPEAEKERDIEQAVTDAQQAASIDDIATAVDTLESAKILVRKMKSGAMPNQFAIEALQLTVDAALAKSTRTLSIPSTESIVLDRQQVLSSLERQIEVSVEGLLDDVKIWINKQLDTVNSKFNYSKLYDQILQEADKTASMASSYKAAASDVEAYKVPVESKALSYLAHAEKTADVSKVFNSYCDASIKYFGGQLSNLERAMAANIVTISKGTKTNDEIAKDFFRNLNEFIHIDGSYIGYGWNDTIGNKVRKLFKQHMNWEPATFDDKKYEKVIAVWAMHPADIEAAVVEFKKFVQAVKDFELNAPKRREELRKAVVNAVETAAGAAEDKSTADAIKKVKNLYLIVIETEKEIDKYIHFTTMHMSDYLRKCASFKTISSNAE